MVRTVVRNGRVFDGTGSAPAEADVTFEDGRIVEVGSGLDGDVAIDAAGTSVIPGMFDCHVHVTVSGTGVFSTAARPFSYQFYEAARNLSGTLDCGITTVRDACGADLGMVRAIENGLIDGPWMQISITALSQTGGHCDSWLPSGLHLTPLLPHPGRPDGVVDGPDAVRQRAREIIRAGADVLKICTTGGVMSHTDSPEHSQFQDDEIAVVVAEAEAVGLPVMAHAHGAKGIKAAVRAGVRSIEHGIFLDEEAIDLMVERGTWLVPTLAAPRAIVSAGASGAGVSASTLEYAEEIVEIHRDAMTRAVDAGVKIAMGTDSGVFPHGANLSELALMVEGGLSPAGALVAATSSAAALLGVDAELGTLTPGKRADLVLVDGDALEFAELKQRVRAVFKDGVKVR
ncbi:Imidazolonepropionase [Amycolatopsis sacchari]|uniref:Imidazolonepropionase n=1 Tax=Amycolatopsis sacchari TaxID=115433 RepID=A0A1I3VLD4_9PSEU|nr:amidohydrolase family protein [Amycolatopsis sacchari]SFJ95126.1 Imidazolonepropionase [Amycolatopsis sacchari]